MIDPLIRNGRGSEQYDALSIGKEERRGKMSELERTRLKRQLNALPEEVRGHKKNTKISINNLNLCKECKQKSHLNKRI